MIFENLDPITAASWMVADPAMFKAKKVRRAFLKIYTHPDLLLQQGSSDEGEPSSSDESNDEESEGWKEVRIKFPPPNFSLFGKDGTHYMMKAAIKSWIPAHLSWDYFDQKWKGPEGIQEALKRLDESIQNEKYRVGVELREKLKRRGADKGARQEARKTRIEQKNDSRELRRQEFLAENMELYQSEDESDGDGDSYTSSKLPGSDVEDNDEFKAIYDWVNSGVVSDLE
ncbi:hypothetical protein BGZ60DRAFT_423306 [Tricladium varicosporioides]|nr:hypothetical protein BGZ60DRAFT_423306 [Hymenoscyphus varicosporioides]